MYRNTLRVLVTIVALICSTLAAGLQRVALDQSAVITSPTSGESHTLIRFDMDQFSGKTVEYAALDLQFQTPDDSCNYFTVILRPITTSWTEEAGWSSGWTAAGGDFDSDTGLIVPVAKKKGYKSRVLLTELAQEWTANDEANFGFMIICLDPAPDKGVLSSVALSGGGGQMSLEVHSSD